MPRKYDVILFDLDGTTADTDSIIIATMNYLYDTYRGGRRTPIEKIYYFSGPPIKGTLKNEFPDMDNEFMFKAFYEKSKTLYRSHVLPFPHCREVLLQLKKEGFKLGVVTSKIHELSKITLEVVHLDDLIDVLIAFDDVKNPKPDKEGIIKGIEYFHSTKERTLYIGDNEIDLLSANNAGIDCALVYWGPRVLSPNLQPKYKLNSFLELKEKLYD